MRRWIVLSFLSAMVFALTCPVLAQDLKKTKKPQFPIELSVFNHAVSLFFQGLILNPIHPGFSLGTEYRYTDGRLGQLYQNIHTGYYFNKYNAKALFVETGIGYRHTVNFGFFVDVTAGGGYLLHFHPKEVYKRNSHGVYEKANNKGRRSFIYLISMGIGYDFSKKVGWPVSLFFRYQPYGQTPYNSDITDLPQSMVHAGIRVQLGKRSSR